MPMPVRCARRRSASPRSLGLVVHVVSNGSRPIRPPGLPNVRMVVVPATPDAADDWIAERIVQPADVCVTSDIPLAARCLATGARAVSSTGHTWTADNIGAAMAGRAVSQHLREIGAGGGGPASAHEGGSVAVFVGAGRGCDGGAADGPSIGARSRPVPI